MYLPQVTQECRLILDGIGVLSVANFECSGSVIPFICDVLAVWQCSVLIGGRTRRRMASLMR